MKSEIKIVALILAVCATLLCGCANNSTSLGSDISSDARASSNQSENTSLASNSDAEGEKDIAVSTSSKSPSTSSKTTDISSNISSHKPSVNKTDKNINTYGNSIGNLNNGGWAAGQGDWVYYSAFDALYKMKSDGSETKKILDKSVHQMNVVDDWIYFMLNFKDNVYRIKTDGSQQKLLLKNVSSFLVVNHKIYYTDSESGYLYRIDENGSNKVLLIEQDCRYDLNVTNDAIYWDNSGVLYVSDINGKNIKSFKDFYPQNLIVDGNVMYESGNLKVSDAKTGKEIKQFFKKDGGAMDINVSGDWIYFIYWEDQSRLYKIKKDGSNMQKLSEMSVMQCLVVGDWIFYTKKEIEEHSDGVRGYSTDRYRMRIDGSDNQMISKWDWGYLNAKGNG